MADNGAIGGGIGQGLLSFVNTYQKQQQLNQENDKNQRYADIAAQKEQAGLLGQGLEVGPGGQVQYNPQYQKMRQNQLAAEQQQAQLQSERLDPESDTSKAKYNLTKQRLEKLVPGSGESLPQGKSSSYYESEWEPYLKEHEVLENAKDVAKLKGSNAMDIANVRGQYGLQAAKERGGQAQDRTAERVHQNAINAITKDPTVNQLKTSYNNLNVALSNFDAEGRTPQAFAELQQALRSNIGVKGSGGVSERAHTYMQSLGLSEGQIEQAITGNPTDVSRRSPKLVEAVVKTVKSEMQNKSDQGNKRLDELSKAHAGFYRKQGNEDRSADFDDTLNTIRGNFSPKESAGEAKGLIQPQKQAGPPPGLSKEEFIKWKAGQQ